MNTTILFANPIPVIKIFNLAPAVKRLKSMIKNNFVVILLSAPV